MLRRYRRDDGLAPAFWEIELRDDVSFTCRWGEVGASGRNERNYAFDDPAQARATVDRLIAEHADGGFAPWTEPPSAGSPIGRPIGRPIDSDDDEDQRVTQRVARSDLAAARAAVAPAGSRASAPAKPSTTSNPQLEAMLADDSDDAGTWSVYADWLGERGEAWGGTIAAAVNRSWPREDQEAVTKSLLGGLDNSTIEWRYGTIERVSLCPETDDDGDYPRTLARILRHPAGRLVRELELGLPPDEDIDWSFDTIIPVIAKAGPLPLLRVLDLTPDAEFMDQDSWRRIGDLRKLWKAAPRLRELHLKGSEGSEGDPPIRLGNIVAPHLETLIFISSGLDRSVPTDIGRATLPALRHLELYVGQEDYGNTCKVKSFADIFEGRGLPNLEYLGIENSEWEGKLIAALARAPIVKRLKVLDLGKGTLYREATEALIARAAAFRHLERLVLDDNYFDEAQQQAIQQAIPCADLGDQKQLDDDDDDYRYPTVGE